MTPTPDPKAVLKTGVCLPAVLPAALLGLASAPAFAADPAEPQDAAERAPQQSSPERENELGTGAGEIVVQRERLRGELDVEQAPLLELGEADIAAEGVTSIGELITQVSNQTGSARGRGGGGQPIILINGIRVGSFREFFRYPPEALAKVEVFPEEVAQRFGFAPDRRVVNLILKENYSTRTVQARYQQPGIGGYSVNSQELGLLQVKDGGRINIDFEARDNDGMTESVRAIAQTPGSVSELTSDPAQSDFRSLINDGRSLEGTISWAKAYLETGTSVSASLNYNRNDTLRLTGLNFVTLTDPSGSSLVRTFGEESPLTSKSASDTFSTSGSFSKSINSWRLTSTVDGSLNETEQQIARQFDTSALEADAAAGLIALDAALPSSLDSGFDIANTQVLSGTMQNTLEGTLFDLPGGEVRTTFDVGLGYNRNETADTRTASETILTRRRIATGANLVVPITSRRNGFADVLGSFTLNLQAGMEDLSDFGVLGDYNVALNWAPTDRLNLSANYIVREVAPSLASLGNPELTFFNTPVFDFVNGETVLATVRTGGNPDLLAETQRDWRFAANWQLPFIDNTRLTVEYIRNRSEDVTRGFPNLTPEIEAAFPDRLTRDNTGRLIEIDTRSVTFSETRADRLQISLFTRGRIGGGGQRGRPPGARGSGRPGAGGAPPSQSQSGSPQQSASGANAQDRRAQFMAMRERVCADDGMEFLTRLVKAAENGEDLSAEYPAFTPERAQRLLGRIRNADGEITPEALTAFRDQVCAMDPAMMGAQQGPKANGAGQSGAPAGPPQGAGGMREAFAALRARICGEDGAEQLAKIVAAIEAGEDISELVPGMDPAFLKRMLDRSRGEDGAISPEALEQFRTRVCSSQGGPGGGSGGRGAGGGGPFGGGNPFAQGSRPGFGYFVNLTHTIELENEILIAPGLVPLDQLNGDATGNFGLPRHATRLEAGIFGSGTGLRLSGRYTGSTTLNGSGLPGAGDLEIGDLVRFDLRLFSDLGDLFGKNDTFLKKLRVSLRMDNVFDTRRKVTDQNGDTPINYQPFLIDPTGRYIGIDFRKLF